jgi:hypothetical protein
MASLQLLMLIAEEVEPHGDLDRQARWILSISSMK